MTKYEKITHKEIIDVETVDVLKNVEDDLWSIGLDSYGVSAVVGSLLSGWNYISGKLVSENASNGTLSCHIDKISETVICNTDYDAEGKRKSICQIFNVRDISDEALKNLLIFFSHVKNPDDGIGLYEIGI